MTYDIQNLADRSLDKGLEKTVDELLPQCSAVTLTALKNALNEEDESCRNIFFAELIRQMEMLADDLRYEDARAEREAKDQLKYQNKLYERNCL